ncbi:HAMP domain-containing sensor histidine kinase [Arcobacter sp. LA11]|uniref:sensor histidine kinase n=1 Tax=Arcobacter sp. LA11 TaxID=1898176 RepID=UPI0009329DCA|nr:HAMP domain-containing sensor histidine kinase [Arcobacter sp. LA11]
MNKSERKALVSFLSIYIGSALLLIGILLYFYYQDEVESLENTCNMTLGNASMQIKTDILNSYMHHQKFVPKKLEKDVLRYALFDEDKKLIYSYIDGVDFVDLEKKFYESDIYHFYIEKLNDPKIPIKYIVIETCQGIEDRDSLKVYVVIALLLSAIFVGFIAYFLAKILLKPVREKVEHMDNFIKDSAHELNTPVSVLMTSVSMLKKGKKPDKMMKYIMSSSKQISQIYNDIHFSAFDTMHDSVEETFNLDELVCDSVEYFNDISVTKNITLECAVEPCKILMDRTKTQKVVNNIISNAIKYSNPNSIIKVSLKDSVFAVQDFGIGISENDQKEIFKRYKRVKSGSNIEGGFGIGLDIVKRICFDYKLKLGLISKIDEGSTFSIDFTNIVVTSQ